MGMLKAAVRYGYSNTRAKAMESKLIDGATMRNIADAKSIDAILAILFQTDYNASIAKFGGLEISPIMLDFAVSDNMAERVNKLAEITPKGDQHIIRRIIARWDLSNVKLALEAVDRRKPFEEISRYIISSSEFTPNVLRDAVKSDSIDEAFAKLMHNRMYRELLSNAFAAYKKSGNVLDAIAEIDIQHYMELGDLSLALGRTHDKSAALLRMDIDMRNMITLLRAKRKGLRFSDISNTLIKNGDVSIRSLAGIYNSSDDVTSLASKSRSFDLKNAVDVYKVNNQLLSFEISMRNQIFNTSMHMLRASVLSFGALVDYVYLKEIEVFTIRALIKGREYGLTKEDVSRLVVWNL